MSEEQDWYYMHGEQQLGPVSPEDLQLLAGGGAILPDTQLWTEGLEEWVPASNVEGLFPEPEPAHPHLILGAEAQAAHPLAGEIIPSETAAAAVPQVAAASIHVAGTVTPQAAVAPIQAAPYAYPGQVDPQVAVAPLQMGHSGLIAPPGTDYPSPGPMKASFGKLLAFPILAIVCLVGGFIFVFLRVAASAKASGEIAAADMGTMLLEAGAVLISSVMAFALCVLIFLVLKMIVLHRAWRCLQFGGARTTPGRAVGLLFVPFYNLYWMFVAYVGLAKDWNRISAQHPNLIGAPRMSEGLAVSYCISAIILLLGHLGSALLSMESGDSPLAIPILVVWFITLILELIFFARVCRLINFMGRLHLRQAHPAGGMRLY